MSVSSSHLSLLLNRSSLTYFVPFLPTAAAERVQQGAGGVYCGQRGEGGGGPAPLGRLSRGGQAQGGDTRPRHREYWDQDLEDDFKPSLVRVDLRHHTSSWKWNHVQMIYNFFLP